MIPSRQSGLGRGLGAIIPPKSVQGSSPVPTTPPALENPLPPVDPVQEQTEVMARVPFEGGGETITDVRRVMEIPIEDIERNPYQPRTHFDHGELEALIASIKEHGILQPLVVSPIANGKYQLIAGERRLRAMGILGYRQVPILIREASEQQKLELAIIENVQREDLNPMEEARAYMRLSEEFGLTQEQIADKVGKSRPQVANTMRLVNLPGEIQEALIERKISASNARTLLSLPTDQERIALFHAMLANQFTVRQTETRVAARRRSPVRDPNAQDLEDRLRTWLHCKVQIKQTAKGDGEIRLKYFSQEELKGIIEKLGPQNIQI